MTTTSLARSVLVLVVAGTACSTKQANRVQDETAKWKGREKAIEATLEPVMDAIGNGDAAALEKLLPDRLMDDAISPRVTVTRDEAMTKLRRFFTVCGVKPATDVIRPGSVMAGIENLGGDSQPSDLHVWLPWGPGSTPELRQCAGGDSWFFSASLRWSGQKADLVGLRLPTPQ